MQVACVDFYSKVHLIDSSNLIDRQSVYGVYIEDNSVLLIQDPRSLRWELPGGGVEPGETTVEALTREFIEETGVTPHGPFGLVSEWEELYYDVPSAQAWRSKRKFYRISIVRGKEKLLYSGNGDDSAKAKFVLIPDIETINMQPSIKEVIART